VSQANLLGWLTRFLLGGSLCPFSLVSCCVDGRSLPPIEGRGGRGVRASESHRAAPGPCGAMGAWVGAPGPRAERVARRGVTDIGGRHMTEAAAEASEVRDLAVGLQSSLELSPEVGPVMWWPGSSPVSAVFANGA
jgi:hypothetical protein